MKVINRTLFIQIGSQEAESLRIYKNTRSSYTYKNGNTYIYSVMKRGLKLFSFFFFLT